MSGEAGARKAVMRANYSTRVVLKSIMSRDDQGVGLIGQRVVIGGWVRDSIERRKETLSRPDDKKKKDNSPPSKDVKCREILRFKIPILGKVIRVFGGGNDSSRKRLDSVNPTPLPPPPSISYLPVADGQPSSISYLHVTDGSCVPTLQVAVDSSIAPSSQIMPVGTCILAVGILSEPSVGGKHMVELQAEKILHVGMVDHEKYPLTEKGIRLESLRDYPHFRPRTTMVASVMRIRNSLTFATHSFFHNHGFIHVDAPIITDTDSKGFGEKFHVATFFNKLLGKKKERTGVSLEIIKESNKDKSKEALVAAVQDLKQANKLALQLEASKNSKSGSCPNADNLDFCEDIFSCQCFLTTSGCLHLESYGCALGNVYSFGPRFQATKSESPKQASEMWMVEMQMAFSLLEDSISCANDYFTFLCKWVLENCSGDLKFISKRTADPCTSRLQSVASCPFEKISYTEAVEALKRVTDRTFEAKIEWGASFGEEHMRYLSDVICKKPVVVYDHPKGAKPFYARLNDDGRTVASFDVAVPKVGTIITGSQNEERINVLAGRIKEMGLPREKYEWYLDLRRHGAVQTSSFSLYFDRMVLFTTALNDVRDVIPFPTSIRNKIN